MIKKIILRLISKLLGVNHKDIEIKDMETMPNIVLSVQSSLQNEKIVINIHKDEKQTYLSNEVEEYYFKVINSSKLAFEQETDSNVFESYEEYDEGDYPLHLEDTFYPHLYFYSKTDKLMVKYQIFLTFNITLRQRAFFNNATLIQDYFINKYNTCFFFDKDLETTTKDFTKLSRSISFNDFKEVIYINLNKDLLHIINSDTMNKLYYNWDFYLSNGNDGEKGVNVLSRVAQDIPYPNLSKVQEPEKLKQFAYMNIEELSNFTPDTELAGLDWNAKNFDGNYENEIFEKLYTGRYKIRPKSRNILKALNSDPIRLKLNLDILDKWFLSNENIKPFQIK